MSRKYNVQSKSGKMKSTEETPCKPTVKTIHLPESPISPIAGEPTADIRDAVSLIRLCKQRK